MPGPANSELSSVETILRAASFAAEKHASQRRKGETAEPYVNHLLEVAHLVSTALAQPDANLIVAALLHDVVEDASVTGQQLGELFGPDVASLVAEVTDDKSLPQAERKRLQVLNAPRKTPRAQYIKLADKISNLRALSHSLPVGWTDQRRREYFEWAKQVVDGLSSPDPSLKAEFYRVYSAFTAQP
jgi:(p)ppGpp synthase/HD superfamily hydrolase